MPYKKKSKGWNALQLKISRKTLWIILIVVLSAAMVLLSLLGWFWWRQSQEAKEAAAQPRIIVPEGYFAPVSYEYTYQKGVKGAWLTAGVDFYTNPLADEAALSAELDGLLADAKALEMNAIYIGAVREGQVIYASAVLRSTPVDVLKLLLEKAAAQEMTVHVVFPASGVYAADWTSLDNPVEGETRGILSQAVAELVKGYEFESILLDGYSSVKGGDSYAAYVESGRSGSYESWLVRAVNATVDDLAQTVKRAKESLPVGLCVSPVWANDTTEGGSATTAAYQSLLDGYADTKGMAVSGLVDFVNVVIPNSTVDSKIPFETAVKWWGALCKENSIPMYVSHSGENAGNETLEGWTRTDDLARQVALSVSSGNYYGSIFSGLSNLKANPGGCTDILQKYYHDEYSTAELFQDLTVSLPTKTSFVTYEPTQQFRMKFDPNAEVTLNGEKITPTEKGGASIWKDLKIGTNTFVLESKGNRVTYTITRKIEIFKSVSPSKNMKVVGSSTLEFNAMAYRDSVITATLNGTTVKLTMGGAGEDNDVESMYVNYRGTYTVPKAGKEEKSIGKVSFAGTYQGSTQYVSGGSITIDKLPDEVDPDAATGQMLTHATVSSRYANTYPFLTTPGYPQAILYQLPAGTMDIVESQNGDFLNLRSGKTIKAEDASVETLAFPGNNQITQVQYSIEGNDSVIRMTMGWKAPFSLTLSPAPTDPEGTANGYQFAANTVTLLFDYATTLDTKQILGTLEGSPIFTGSPKLERIRNEERGIYQYRMTLSLSQAGRYYGCHAAWEDNTLVLRFNHPPTSSGSLSGVRICVDAGHGGSDNGTMAGNDVLEKEVNLIMAQKVQQQLEALGAEVIMTRTGDTNPSLIERVRLAEQYNCDLFIACHHNSAGSNAAPSGVETYFNAPFSQPLAQYVQNQLGNYMTNRGWKSSIPNYNFIVTREKQFPSILIEFGFLSNPNDEALAQDPTHQDNMAAAVAQGVLDYYAAFN